MRSKIIHDANGERTFAIILETGDEVPGCLGEFARQHELQAASFKAIGAFSSAKLAFFDWESKEYLPIPVDEQVEVASLTGDIAIGPDGKQPGHCRRTGTTRCGAGRLSRAPAG